MPETSANDSARSRIRSIPARSSSSIVIRCRGMRAFMRPRLWARSCRLGLGLARGPDCDLVVSVELLDAHVDVLILRGRDVLADIRGLDRELAVPAVDQHCELDACG